VLRGRDERPEQGDHAGDAEEDHDPLPDPDLGVELVHLRRQELVLHVVDITGDGVLLRLDAPGMGVVEFVEPAFVLGSLALEVGSHGRLDLSPEFALMVIRARTEFTLMDDAPLGDLPEFALMADCVTEASVAQVIAASSAEASRALHA